MEKREHALKLYKKCYHYHRTTIDDETTTKLRDSIQLIVLDFLSLVLPKQKFTFTEVSDVLRDSANTVQDFGTGKCQHAFEALESLIILVLSTGWKQEYYQLKLYGGYIQSRIIPQIPQVDIILRKMGYIELTKGSGLLLLQNEPNEDLLVKLGFDCFVAAVECRFASILHKNMNSIGFTKFTQKDAVLWRFVLSGTIDQNVVALRKTIGKPDIDVRTSDQHKFVRDDKRTSVFDNRRESTSITNETLHHFHPPIMSNYLVSKGSNSRKDHDEHKMEDNYTNDKYGTSKNESTGLNDLNIKHQGTETITKIRSSPGDDSDPYKMGTLDEHLLASLKQLDQGDKSHKKSKEDDSSKLKSRSTEWDYVTDKLKSTSPQKFRHLSDSFDKEMSDLRIPLTRDDRTVFTPKQPVYPPQVSDILDNSQHHGLLSRGSTYDNVTSATSKIHKDLITSRKSPDEFGYEIRPRIVKDSGSRSARESSYEPQERLVPPVVNSRSKSEPILRKVVSGKSLSYPYETSPVHRRVTIPHDPPHYQFDNSNDQYMIQQAPQFKDHTNSTVMSEFSPLNQWCCTFCTVLNHPNDKICKECFKSRSVGPELDLPNAGESRKVCEQCTLENPAEAIVCDVCGGPLKNVHTYI